LNVTIKNNEKGHSIPPKMLPSPYAKGVVWKELLLLGEGSLELASKKKSQFTGL